MAARKPALFDPARQLVRNIVDLCEGENSDGAHAALRAWRTLSRQDRQVSDAAARLPSVADHVVVSCDRPPAALRKLTFYARVLKVEVKKLTLRNGNSNDFEGFEACPKVQSVDLQGCRGSLNNWVQKLTKCAELREVDFGGIQDDRPPTAEAAAALLAAHFPALRSVDLASVRSVTDVVVERLAKCPMLERLVLYGCTQLTDQAAAHLADCPQLRFLELRACDNLTDEAATHLGRCARLETLSLYGCPQVTAAAAEPLAACRTLAKVQPAPLFRALTARRGRQLGLCREPCRQACGPACIDFWKSQRERSAA